MKTHIHSVLLHNSKCRLCRKIILLAVLGAVSLPAAAQTRDVSGRVTSPDQEPVMGASVTIKSKHTGTVTDLDGNFKIKASDNDTLVFSFIGMVTQEIRVGTKTKIDVVLLNKTIDLDDVVAIGYGHMRKRDVTGAISSVSGQDIESRMTTGVLEALQGQIPGMEIISGSGQPGESSTVRIRGISTFSDEGASPLFIVDGVPMDDITIINPMDIASVEVLKDAASAAIYGSRSANGVILITTKQGDPQKPTINIRYNHSWSFLAHRMEVTTPQLWRRFARERLSYAQNEGAGWVSDSFINMDTALLNDSLNYMFNANNDYQKLAFQTAQKQQVDASIGGGNKALRYLLSAGYLHESGIIPNTDYSRISARLNTDYMAGKNLKLVTKVSFIYAERNGIDEANYLNSLMRRLPNLSLYFPDETLAGRIWGVNPLGYMYATNIRDEYRGTLYQAGELQLAKGLKLVANISASYAQNRFKRMTPSFILSETQKTNNANSVSNLSWNWLNEDYITYENKWGKHSFSGLLGFSVQEWNSESDKIYGSNSPSDYIYTMNGFVSLLDRSNTGTFKSEHAMASFFSRVTYNYDSRYLFAATLRVDRSSRFSRDNRWGYFPSVSAAWRLSDEKFMKWAAPVLSDAKIRASYGITGIESIGDYDYLMTYDIGGVYDDIATITPKSLGLGGLGWEQTNQFNVGLDLFLFNRMNISLDYYDKQTKDLLANHQLPKEIGFNTIRKNIGEVSNRGLELVIGGDIIKSKNFRWYASFNIATNTNKIKRLSGGNPYLLNSIWWVQEGGKIGDFYGYKNLGIFRYNESNAFTDDWKQLTPVFVDGVFQDKYLLNGQEYSGNINKKRHPNGEAFRGGDINWENVSDSDGEKGVINESDRQVLGNAQPDVFGGLNTTFQYKGFTLSLAFTYSVGGKMYNQARFGANKTNNANLVPTRDFIENMWTKQGDIATYPRPVADIFQNGREVDSRYIEDASYIRFKSFRLGYKLPSKACKKIHLKSLEFYFYGNNLLLWTAYSGYDPEISTGSALQIGLDNNRYPKKREFGLGTSINF